MSTKDANVHVNTYFQIERKCLIKQVRCEIERDKRAIRTSSRSGFELLKMLSLHVVPKSVILKMLSVNVDMIHVDNNTGFSFCYDIHATSFWRYVTLNRKSRRQQLYITPFQENEYQTLVFFLVTINDGAAIVRSVSSILFHIMRRRNKVLSTTLARLLGFIYP